MESHATHRPPTDADAGPLCALHKLVLRARALDERLAALQQQGIVAEHRPYGGEESALIGAVSALHEEDWVLSEGSELPIALARGATFSELVARPRTAGGPDPLTSRRLRSVAAGWKNGAFVTHGVGIAWGAKIAHAGTVVLVTFTEATLATGEFHNGLNFAGVFKAPVVFLARLRSAVPPHVSARTKAYGIRGVTCDGSDLLAVMERVREARARAAAGEGPTWIEAHIEGDDRIDKLRRHLEGRRLWSASDDVVVAKEIEQELAEVIALLEKVEPTAPQRAALFEHTFAAPTWNLREQRDGKF